MVDKICAFCNSNFKTYPSLNRILCCSIPCSKKLQWLHGKYSKRHGNFHKGMVPWNKGVSKEHPAIQKMIKSRMETDNYKGTATFKGKKHSEESKKRISESRTGIPAWNKGIESLRKGKKSNLWKGGITPSNHVIRTSMKYKQWRRNIFERDDYTCQNCKKHGGNLNADHIKPFALFPELRFDIDNGRTMCIPCHRDTDTYGNKTRMLKCL